MHLSASAIYKGYDYKELLLFLKLNFPAKPFVPRLSMRWAWVGTEELNLKESFSRELTVEGSREETIFVTVHKVHDD